MATHSSIMVWKIPWTEEPSGLPSMGSQRVGHDWVTEHMHTHRVYFRLHSYIPIKSERELSSSQFLQILISLWPPLWSLILIICYRLNMSIPKVLCWNPDSQCDDIRLWGLWGLIGSWRRDTRKLAFSLSALLCDETARRWPSTNQKVSSYQNQICKHVDLRLSNLQNCGKQMFVV